MTSTTLVIRQTDLSSRVVLLFVGDIDNSLIKILGPKLFYTKKASYIGIL